MAGNRIDATRDVFGAIPLIKGLICQYKSATEIDIRISACRYKSFETSLDVTWNATAGTALNGWDDTGEQRVIGKSEHYVWLLMNSLTGSLATVAAYNKPLPDIDKPVFDGYEVVTLLTHFVIDTSNHIVKFKKKNNDWIVTIGPYAFELAIGNNVYTNALEHDITLAIPLIPEISVCKYHLRTTSPIVAGQHVMLSYESGNIDYSRFMVIIANEPDVTANMVPTHWGLEFPYTQKFMYTGTSDAVSHTLAIEGCKYNNITGF